MTSKDHNTPAIHNPELKTILHFLYTFSSFSLCIRLLLPAGIASQTRFSSLITSPTQFSNGAEQVVGFLGASEFCVWQIQLDHLHGVVIPSFCGFSE